MVNINLLPDELRGEERKEREKLAKKPKVLEFKMHSPPLEKEKKKKKKTSLTARISRAVERIKEPPKPEKLPDVGSLGGVEVQPRKEKIKFQVPRLGKDKPPKLKTLKEDKRGIY